MKLLFLHGWTSTPGGRKPTYLASHGHEVINPALPDDDFEEAVRIAQTEYDQHQPDVIVGSSRGGAVAMNFDSKDTPLVLLCPAWKNWGSATTVKPKTTILHSRADDVVPFENSEELVRNSRLAAWILVECGTDHRLADPEPLDLMQQACLVYDGEFDESAESDAEEDVLNKDWSGLCYSAALRWIRDADDDWNVVHGTVYSAAEEKRIEHAWCERRDLVVDLAIPIGAKIINRDKYYEVLSPTDCTIYTADEASIMMLKTGHHLTMARGVRSTD